MALQSPTPGIPSKYHKPDQRNRRFRWNFHEFLYRRQRRLHVRFHSCNHQCCPADSPWATGVGGVTAALNADNSIAWQAGWGNNEILIAEEGFVADPPTYDSFGFIGGSGGGPSGFFAKPSYQKKLGGKYRQLPDISWLADPYTGAAILISIPYQQPAQVWQV